MERFDRYAVYYTPPPGAFARAGAAWLGRDVHCGAEVPHPTTPPLPRPLADITARPRKYGFHGTLKAPFRPVPGCDGAALAAAVSALAAARPAIAVPQIALRRIGSFLAFVTVGHAPALADLAAAVVRDLDHLRAALTEAEIARRNPDRLTPRQRANLHRFGYPHILDEFRFHLTLSGPLTDAEAPAIEFAAAAHFAGTVPEPLPVTDLGLFGAGADGRFRLISRHRLAG